MTLLIRRASILNSAVKKPCAGWCRKLRRNGLGIIVDIVPNHMAIGSDNRMVDGCAGARARKPLCEILSISTGRQTIPHLHGKVALPILGRPYGEALAAGEITVQCGKTDLPSSAISITASHSRPQAPLRLRKPP